MLEPVNIVHGQKRPFKVVLSCRLFVQQHIQTWCELIQFGQIIIVPRVFVQHVHTSQGEQCVLVGQVQWSIVVQ